MADETACPLCRGPAADAELDRVEVWSDPLWRLTVSLVAEVAGFAYLEPRRHIADLSQLDGAEAATLGPVLARCSRALKELANAELVYVYVFGGGIPHLHLHLAPHHRGDALNEQMIRGEVVERQLESGMVEYLSADFPPLPRAQLTAFAERVSERLGGGAGTPPPPPPSAG
jgi:diadenosine tetraphosphate (Ap4A) HIT family hydrolase